MLTGKSEKIPGVAVCLLVRFTRWLPLERVTPSSQGQWKCLRHRGKVHKVLQGESRDSRLGKQTSQQCWGCRWDWRLKPEGLTLCRFAMSSSCTWQPRCIHRKHADSWTLAEMRFPWWAKQKEKWEKEVAILVRGPRSQVWKRGK